MMLLARGACLLCIVLLLPGLAPAQVVATYTVIPGTSSILLSPDGTVVKAASFHHLDWTGGQLTLIPEPWSYQGNLSQAALSRDGSIVVGSFYGQTRLAGRWERPDWPETLPLLDPDAREGRAIDVSADGSVVVGEEGVYLPEPMRWIDGVPTPLPPLEGETLSSARGVSADGSVVVGGSTAGIYRYADGVTELVFPLTPVHFSVRVNGVSSDGTAIVGQIVSTQGLQAFRWQNGELSLLGDLPGPIFESEALAASADGSLIAGMGWPDQSDPQSAVWDEEHGMLDLRLLLEYGYGVEVEAPIISGVWEVSDDGVILVGRHKSSGEHAFVAAIPYSCDDGLDNDGDGYADYPDDPGCSSPADRFEVARHLPCDDASDNDRDGLVDFPEDPGCAAGPAALSESPAAKCGLGFELALPLLVLRRWHRRRLRGRRSRS